MYKRTRIVLILVFLPLLLGILASFLAQRVWEPVPLLQFKIDVGMVAFVAGGFLTLLTGIAFLAGWTRERNAQRQIEGALHDSELGRQRFIRRLDHEIKNPLTGLRAALLNRIVTLHGGQIDVPSRQDGPHGTVFTVRLPEKR